MIKTRLYFEAHITVQPEEAKSFAWFSDIFGSADWKASQFDVDMVDDATGMWFLTARADDLDDLRDGLIVKVDHLRGQGLRPLRAKIEETILDSKYDPLLAVTA